MDQQLLIDYQAFSSLSEMTSEDRELVEAAVDACKDSYSPYSKFRVGAALRLANGVIVKGANQENAAFGAGICAERTALFYAHAHQPDVPVAAIAIAARKEGEDFTLTPISPCGICRQVLLEFEQRQGSPISVWLFGREAVYCFPSAASLLPMGFEMLHSFS